MNVYLFQLFGQIDLDELNAMSPHQMTTLQGEPSTTRFSIHTDQSGMIGMIQHLHNLGLTIQSIVYQLAAESLPDVSTEAKRI